MSNKNIFTNKNNVRNQIADVINEAGGKAYQMSDKQALAQIAATNCFNGTYYSSAEDNLKLAKTAALKLKNNPEFIAKVAIYSRDRGYMKDMPAFLTVMLADTNIALFKKVFPRVIDNAKMLRNFCQMARSGAVTGRVFNLSSRAIRSAVQDWFDSRNCDTIFRAIVGNNPTLADIIRMARPKPNSSEKEALFGYILNKKVDFEKLPGLVQQYEKYKATREGEIPNVDFRMLDSLNLTDQEWVELTKNAKWMMTRMNLNTFARHNVFKNEEMVKMVAERIANKDLIKSAKAFPYQLLSAWKATSGNTDIPFAISESLQDAMEIAVDNVPAFEGKIYVCVDASGSMNAPVTGGTMYSGKPTDVRCSDVAGLVASAIIRKNRSAEVWTFANSANRVTLNTRDSVMTNAQKLSKAGGGTNISAPLVQLNKENAKGTAVIYVSDNESWVDSYYGSTNTRLMTEWETFQRRNPNAKLICVDVLARANSQVKERKNILQVGGFSDDVLNVMSTFIEYGHDSNNHWVQEIERISID